MATYNGEKHLGEQIDSIIAQSYQNWELLVSDDGSSDATLKILKEYAKKDSRIKIVNETRQGGVVDNFAKALEFVSSDYIMFCDQDDVWLGNKIEALMQVMNRKEAELDKSTPILIFSDRTVVDENKELISESAFAYQKVSPEYNLDQRFLFWRSTVFGCSTIFNKALYDAAMPMPSYVPMHDHWFALNATQHGCVVIYQKTTMMYRVHMNNVVGGVKKVGLSRFFVIGKATRKIRKAAIKIRRQYVYFCGSGSDAGSISFAKRVVFIIKNVIPYMRHNVAYSFLFSLFFIFSRDNSDSLK
ncbi:glycosyltransferase family 2 protein [Chromohalobacter israelensis]|uniref:glycosyltransferase family 2 protein n=1 Tax=Chromohalobacter israelensis TaxID=141390 RepID=UPI003AF5AD34